MPISDLALLDFAQKVSFNSYSPYSGLKVGAALLDAKNDVFCGTNFENVSYPAGVCAERSALAVAVAKGRYKFTKLAVVGSGKDIITPCGICRQVLAEFGIELEVLCSNYEQLENLQFDRYILKDLLPLAFLKI